MAAEKEGHPVEVTHSANDENHNIGSALNTRGTDSRIEERGTTDKYMAPVGGKRRASSGEQGPSAPEETIPPHETSDTVWNKEGEHPLQVGKI